ncbi:MAG: hypothetical protein WCO09_03950 [bacterium]
MLERLDFYKGNEVSPRVEGTRDEVKELLDEINSNLSPDEEKWRLPNEELLKKIFTENYYAKETLGDSGYFWLDDGSVLYKKGYYRWWVEIEKPQANKKYPAIFFKKLDEERLEKLKKDREDEEGSKDIDSSLMDKKDAIKKDYMSYETPETKLVKYEAGELFPKSVEVLTTSKDINKQVSEVMAKIIRKSPSFEHMEYYGSMSVSHDEIENDNNIAYSFRVTQAGRGAYQLAITTWKDSIYEGKKRITKDGHVTVSLKLVDEKQNTRRKGWYDYDEDSKKTYHHSFDLEGFDEKTGKLQYKEVRLHPFKKGMEPI